MAGEHITTRECRWPDIIAAKRAPNDEITGGRNFFIKIIIIIRRYCSPLFDVIRFISFLRPSL